MPDKLSPYRSPGEKIISLFARLLFSGERYSLTELAKMLGCSKQTVIRNVNEIRKAYGVDIEETTDNRQSYYRLRTKMGNTPFLPLTASELSALRMCQAFTSHILGNDFLKEAARAIEKSQILASSGLKSRSDCFASFCTGTIDYTPYQSMIRTLMEAMDSLRACKITYHALMAEKAKTFLIEPLKIFSYRDSLYLDARLTRKVEKDNHKPAFDPLLVIHRLKRVEITDQHYIYPADYSFDEVFDRNFGIIKDSAFEVVVKFTGWAAHYVTERIWSPNQKIKKLRENKILLTFTATSEPEVISWILSFGDEARIIEPEWLVAVVAKKSRNIDNMYS